MDINELNYTNYKHNTFGTIHVYGNSNEHTGEMLGPNDQQLLDYCLQEEAIHSAHGTAKSRWMEVVWNYKLKSVKKM